MHDVLNFFVNQFLHESFDLPLHEFLYPVLRRLAESVPTCPATRLTEMLVCLPSHVGLAAVPTAALDWGE